MKAIALVGDYDPGFEPHRATNRAIEHSRNALDTRARCRWIGTDELDPRIFAEFSGILVAPGSPYRDLEKALKAIQYARKQGVPCLGTCGGFQHMVLEYARNVLGRLDVQHAEYDSEASELFISKLDCSLVGRELKLQLTAGSSAAKIYGSPTTIERYYCNFGVNPRMVPLLRQGPLQITGADAEGEVRVVELPGHPFYIGTLFVPQARSTAAAPHPLVSAFLKAATEQRA